MIYTSVAEVVSFVPRMCWSVLFVSPQLLSPPSADIIRLLLARLIVAIPGLQTEASQGQDPA